MAGVAPTTSENHLFATCRKTIFPSFLCQEIFLSERSRPDVQATVAFLTTWVTEPEKDDYKN